MPAAWPQLLLREEVEQGPVSKASRDDCQTSERNQKTKSPKTQACAKPKAQDLTGSDLISVVVLNIFHRDSQAIDRTFEYTSA